MTPEAARRVLVTGFEPFGGEPLNPSEMLVRELVSAPSVSTAVLPVDWRALPDALDAALKRSRPEVVVSVGQATGRDAVDIETVAVNALDYRGESDNGGHVARGEPIADAGTDAIESSLPLARWCDALADEGLPVRLSRDAGRHLCNAVYYLLLTRDVPALFLHVPLLPEQAERRGKAESSLPLETSRACLQAILRHV